MLVRVYAFIHYPKLPDCVSTLSAYFYFYCSKRQEHNGEMQAASSTETTTLHC